MSYDIELVDPSTKKLARLPSKIWAQGGTYHLGGSDRAEFNITWNYSPHYYRLFPENQGLRWLYGKIAKDTVPVIQQVMDQLGDDTHPDYWEPTEGNAKQALKVLLLLARACPEAVWEGD